MRQTPVNDYLEEISTELPEEIYECLSDAIYETTCEFDEEVGLLKAENTKLSTQLTDVTESMGRVEERCAKLRELLQRLLTEYRYMRARPRRTYLQHERRMRVIEEEMRSLGIEV